MSEFQHSAAFKAPHCPQESELCERIVTLEELTFEQDRRIADLQNNLISQELTIMTLNQAIQPIRHLENGFTELVEEFKALRKAAVSKNSWPKTSIYFGDEHAIVSKQMISILDVMVIQTF